MSDECPPEILNPGVRKNWHLFDAESRAGFLLDARGDQRAASRGVGNGRTNGPHGSRQSQYYGLGMRPPQGDPYNTEEYNADGEGDGTSAVDEGVRQAGLHLEAPETAATEHADEPPEGSDDDADDVYAPDLNTPKDDSDPLTIVNTKYKELSPTQKKAILKCQSAVSASFRDVTGVPTTKHPWPKWTGEGDWTGPGMEINLEGTVTHRVNLAMQDLKKDKSTHQLWMNAPDVKLTLGLLIEIAKCTFRGFKRPYRAQHDADAKKRLDDNGRFSRWLSRRRQTCQNLMSAVPEYKEIYGVDPTPLLVADLMSDEASGPEEGSETVLEWKRRMATLEGRVDVSDEFLTKKTYFEVITPNWRSDALTKIYHELARLWYNALSVRFANAMVTRIRTSKRATNVPPPYTPYNFGINQEWYAKNKSEPAYKILLRMWGQFPDPPGFGANTEPEAAPAETINAAASTSGSV
ncbi:uncharacterized protein TRAVEDRAFT_52739 [Trametes versicolor FP-101664 SS1]|uniref:uncharacterized protein n=1 Tax=Trametes versicolor (strain FP-101664) TaxID=717944 RepID=UPI0004623535|nr:uncharacterized protein TRAVEDRAFT_52739 [Trametes versicolor FP-101664 SS1]EIW53621.1 hypothetical protein TRAVEDRAFT_52739 [Trametes versicolor FP-101664 SS1]